MGVSLEVKVMAWLEFELAYYDVAVKLVNHYIMDTPSLPTKIHKYKPFLYVVAIIDFYHGICLGQIAVWNCFSVTLRVTFVTGNGIGNFTSNPGQSNLYFSFY